MEVLWFIHKKYNVMNVLVTDKEYLLDALLQGIGRINCNANDWTRTSLILKCTIFLTSEIPLHQLQLLIQAHWLQLLHR